MRDSLAGYGGTVDGALLASRLVQQVESAIVATDLDGVVRFWNRTAESLFGIPADHAVGRSMFDVANLGPDLRERILTVAIDRGRWQAELLIRRVDGSAF